MTHKIRGALAAIAVASSWAGVQPAVAQTLTLPEMGIESAGDCRTLNVRNRVNAAQVPMGCLDTSTNGFRWSGDGSGMKALSGITGAVNRTIAEKLFERLSVNDFYRTTDGDDFRPAINRAVASLPNSGGTIYFPRREGCYNIAGPVVIGDGTASSPSTKQNIKLVGDSGSGTGVQTGFNPKGTCIRYPGATKIAAILQFNGPIAISLEGITLDGGYLGYSGTPTATTTAGWNVLTNLSSLSNIVVGSRVSGAGIPDGVVVTAINGGTVVLSANATASATLPLTFTHNEATVDVALSLKHVFRSTVRNVGLSNTRLGMRQDSYGFANGFSTGANDSTFENIWCENNLIAGGSSGSGCFDIGGADATGILDVARITYSNLVAIVAGDPNATGLTLRYADNLTFRGGMLYSQREPGLGYALAIIPPNSNSGREPAFPAEISFQGMAMVGRIYRDPRWKPDSNGNFGITMWPMHAGDMLDPGNAGRGTLPSFNGFTGVDDRGVFFGMSQFRSWLDDASNVSVAYDAPAAVSRKTTLTQVTGVTASTIYATHNLPANAMRSRNSKDYPVGATFPLSNTAQYAYDRVVSLKQSGNWFNANALANIQVIVRLGGTTLWQSGNIQLAASASYGAWRFEGELSQSAPATQSFSGRLVVSQPGSASGLALPAAFDVTANHDTAVDMTGDQPLTVSIVPGNASFVWNAERSIATVH
ncbi:UNVERIFIED_CONTAM: hypothetical protein Q9R58_07540 [Methylobacteriaceae bacterium AG10]|nr:hypothetical protein [Methylobacteriaceae bacterium AG10]